MQASRLTPRGLMIVCLVGLTGLTFAPSAGAQVLDTYMHIDGIVGESVVRGHEGDIVLESYSQTFGTKNCSRIVLAKSLDRASPALIGLAAGNVLIPAVIVSLVKPGAPPLEFFKATFQTVLIERVEIMDFGSTLREQLVLKPRQIRIEYRPQAPNGVLLPPIVTTIDCT